MHVSSGCGPKGHGQEPEAGHGIGHPHRPQPGERSVKYSSFLERHCRGIGIDDGDDDKAVQYRGTGYCIYRPTSESLKTCEPCRRVGPTPKNSASQELLRNSGVATAPTCSQAYPLAQVVWGDRDTSAIARLRARSDANISPFPLVSLGLRSGPERSRRHDFAGRSRALTARTVLQNFVRGKGARRAVVALCEPGRPTSFGRDFQPLSRQFPIRLLCCLTRALKTKAYPHLPVLSRKTQVSPGIPEWRRANLRNG